MFLSLFKGHHKHKYDRSDIRSISTEGYKVFFGVKSLTTHVYGNAKCIGCGEPHHFDRDFSSYDRSDYYSWLNRVSINVYHEKEKIADILSKTMQAFEKKWKHNFDTDTYEIPAEAMQAFKDQIKELENVHI